MKRIFTLLVTLALVGCFGPKGLDVKTVDGQLSEEVDSNIIDHSEWNGMLQEFVDEKGFVDYQGFKKNKQQLDSYLQMLAENPPQGNWPVEEQLAYFINLYNAATVQLVTENYPIESIKDIGGLKGPFLQSFIQVGNEEMTLANLEKGILQKMNEPRIHFAINCASYSCPKLLNQAYTAKNLSKMMDQATTEFINGDKNNLDQYEPELSRIFDWYKSDFTDTGMSIPEYINQYSKTKISAEASISYLPYDWSLNDQK